MNPNRLDMKRKFQPDDYADSDLRTVLRREATSVRQLTSPFSSDSRYMTSLEVFGENKPCFELGAANIDQVHQKILDKIAAALKLLSFREQHVLVQFWWAREVGKHHVLTITDQPYGFGVTDARLCLYRGDSESKSFVVDKDHEEEDRSPAGRVFRRGLPEWTSDLDNCTPKHFLQQECAVRCNLHGYLGLPVFDSNTWLCVGVLELLTASKYMKYDHEVEQVHTALKRQNLISPQGFDFPALYVPNGRMQNDLDKIHGILKTVCGIHCLPLAQTWAVSQHCCFVSHEKVIVKSCSSFDSKCVGKVCMSTAALSYHVEDLRMWDFREACIEQHLDRSCGLVGKALLTRGSCFCGDVTKLDKEEYPLVYNACKFGLTGCFGIFLRSIVAGDDYVLEFFLPPDIKDSIYLLKLVQTLKQKFPIGSGFELGDTSMIQVIGPPTDQSVNTDHDAIQTSSDPLVDNFTSSDSESLMASGSMNLQDQCSSTNLKTCDASTDAGETSNPL